MIKQLYEEDVKQMMPAPPDLYVSYYDEENDESFFNLIVCMVLTEDNQIFFCDTCSHGEVEKIDPGRAIFRYNHETKEYNII